MKRSFHLVHQQARANAVQAVKDAPDGYMVIVTEPTRSLEQNAALWAALADISEQVEWYGRKLDSEAWKHVFTSGIRKLDVVPNLDGTGFVALGLSTSKMTKRELSDLLELIRAFGSERGVEWSDERMAA